MIYLQTAKELLLETTKVRTKDVIYIYICLDALYKYPLHKCTFTFLKLVSHMWMRHDGQSVEEAMIENEACEFPMIYEPLGESVAIKYDNTGFSTISDGQLFSPIYFYQFL